MRLGLGLAPGARDAAAAVELEPDLGVSMRRAPRAKRRGRSSPAYAQPTSSASTIRGSASRVCAWPYVSRASERITER